jgi:hypothetical protein
MRAQILVMYGFHSVSSIKISINTHRYPLDVVKTRV